MKKTIRLTESDLIRIVKKVIKEQVSVGELGVYLNRTDKRSDCSKLEKVQSGMNPGKGLLANGFKPDSPNWEEKLSKVVGHTNMYKFNGEGQEALSLNSKCNRAKKSIDWISFKKGNETITYLGVD